MSKKRWDEKSPVHEVEPEPEPVPDKRAEALAALVRAANDMNGADHMKLCAYYVVASEHCDCGLSQLRDATRRLQCL